MYYFEHIQQNDYRLSFKNKENKTTYDIFNSLRRSIQYVLKQPIQQGWFYATKIISWDEMINDEQNIWKQSSIQNREKIICTWCQHYLQQEEYLRTKECINTNYSDSKSWIGILPTKDYYFIYTNNNQIIPYFISISILFHNILNKNNSTFFDILLWQNWIKTLILSFENNNSDINISTIFDTSWLQIWKYSKIYWMMNRPFQGWL